MGYLELKALEFLANRSRYWDKYHREIEEGCYFGTYGAYTLAAGAHRIGSFITPNSKVSIHMTLPDIYTSEGSIKYEWREGGTVTTAGATQIPVICYNRLKNCTTNITQLLTGVTSVTLGALLYQGVAYGGNKVAGQTKAGVEYVLAPNTLYTLDVHNPTNATLEYYYYRNWYEEGGDD